MTLPADSELPPALNDFFELLSGAGATGAVGQAQPSGSTPTATSNAPSDDRIVETLPDHQGG